VVHGSDTVQSKLYIASDIRNNMMTTVTAEMVAEDLMSNDSNNQADDKQD
jgi:hypothetical protein